MLSDVNLPGAEVVSFGREAVAIGRRLRVEVAVSLSNLVVSVGVDNTTVGLFSESNPG